MSENESEFMGFEPKVKSRFIVYHPTIQSFYIKDVKIEQYTDVAFITLEMYIGRDINIKELTKPENCSGMKICILKGDGTVCDELIFGECKFISSSFELDWDSEKDYIEARIIYTTETKPKTEVLSG